MIRYKSPALVGTAGDHVQEQEPPGGRPYRGIHQPHVRPIVRGKAKTEFGAKINIGLLNGYARVDHFDWNAFNERQDLQSQVERFRKFTGKYPKLVQVDRTYLSRENNRFLKEKGIRHIKDIPAPYFVASLLNQIKVRIINIYPLKPQIKFCA
jgi:hypothetical protein